MREDQRPDKVRQTRTEHIRDQRSRLQDLAEAAKQLGDFEHDAAAKRSSNEPESPEFAVLRQKVAKRLDMQMPFLRTSLADERLTPQALGVFHRLFATREFEKKAADSIAECADHLAKSIKGYTPYMGHVIQLFGEAFAVLEREANMTDPLTPGGEKIRAALDSAGPELEIFFSKANVPAGDVIKDRLKVLGLLLQIGDPTKTEWAIEAAAEHIALVLRNNEYVPHFSTTALLDVLGKQSISHMLERPVPMSAVTRYDVEAMLQDLRYEQARKVMASTMAQFGLPADEYTHESFGYHILDQFELIQKLESERPGAVAELHERFGIRWFTRYGAEVLKAQYDQRDKVDQKYGVFLAAAYDHNAGTFQKNDQTVVSSVAWQLKQLGYALRIIECDSKQEVEYYFGEFKKKYGPSRKASFLFIRAHSWRQHLEFGPDENGGDIDVDDIMGGLGAGPELFVEEPTFILDGCSLGRRGGIGEKASERFSALVFAPKSTASALTKVDITESNGRLAFSAEYEDHQDKKVSPRVYIRGRKR
ncbi:MAG: hypothetical protein HYS26_00890 [Candidatus Kaiserbacteria bacterium]|nr:MAG: hypothetical protein HYS26_00890 [Candidatus Kaiserbacteria bacterium]